MCCTQYTPIQLFRHTGAEQKPGKSAGTTWTPNAATQDCQAEMETMAKMRQIKIVSLQTCPALARTAGAGNIIPYGP